MRFKLIAALNDRLERLWALSPEQNAADIGRRLGLVPAKSRDTPPWRHKKHSQWTRLPCYLEVLRGAAQRAGLKLELKDATVLEVGAGPVLGLAPFALLEGAARYLVVEPRLDDVRYESAFVEEYLRPLFQLSSIANSSSLSFPDFLAAVRDRVEIVRTGIEDFRAEGGQVDLIWSKSCLEHIGDLRTGLRALATCSASESVHVHYVDFSSHRADLDARRRLESIFRSPPTAHPESLDRGGILNLLRPNDMRRIFEECFGRAWFFPTRVVDPIDPSVVHAGWRDLSEESLSTVNGVFVATSPLGS